MATIVTQAERDDGIDLPDTGIKSEPLRITVTKSSSVPSVPVAEEVAPATTELSEPSVVAATENAPAVVAGGKYWGEIKAQFDNGANKQQVIEYLKTNKGMDDDEADVTLVNSLADTVKTLKSQGVTEEVLRETMAEKNYDQDLVNRALASSDVDKSWKRLDFNSDSQAEEVTDVADLYHNIYDKYSDQGRSILGSVGGLASSITGATIGADNALEARRNITRLNVSIAAKMQEDGFDTFVNPENGRLMYRDETGGEQPVDSSFVNSLYNSKFETTGAIAGAAAGFKAGMTAPGRSKLLAAPALGLVGGAMGAAAGRGADMVKNASRLGEDLERGLIVDQMVEAGIYDSVTAVVGGVALKTGGKAITTAWDFTVNGNLNGAYKKLLSNTHISEDQAKEIVLKWKETLDLDALAKVNKMKPKEQGIVAIANTQKEAGNLVSQVASDNPRLAQTFISSIDSRAKDLNRKIDSINDPNLGATVRADLQNYVKDVKDYFGAVKEQGTSAVKGTDFKFTVDELAVAPVRKLMGDVVRTDPLNQTKVLSYVNKVDSLAKDNSFQGLLDLRQTMNDFKYSKTVSPDGMKLVDAVINRIDGKIAKAAKEYMPNGGKDWLANWSNAKKEYGQMKRLEDNAIFKAFEVSNKELLGATEDTLRKKLNKYGNMKDVDAEVFNSVVTRLSPAARIKVEAAAIKNMTEKYTFGNKTDFQATDFPELANALTELNITSNEGKNLLEAVNELAKVFKNDVDLSRISGNMKMPNSPSSLATSAESKAQMFLIGEVWKAVMERLPTQAGNQRALLRRTAKLIENPMQVKSVDSFLGTLPKDKIGPMRSLVKELQIQTAKQAAETGVDKSQGFVKMYRSGAMKASKGAWGEGVYLKTRATGNNITGHEVNMSRMATFEDISNMLATEITEKNLHRHPKAQKMLAERGYLGIKGTDRVMLFPETTVGVKFKPVEQRQWPE